jgi:DNA repair exonuclease SbcCD ATPase subunit
LSPRFGFFKRKTADYFHDKKKDSNYVQSVKNNELLEIVEKEKKALEKDLIDNLGPTKKSILRCLDRLRKNADELQEEEIRVENPQFESIINTSKKILITSIKKESFIDSSEIKNYEDAIKFKNNLELLVNRFGQVGDSHNRILNEFMRKQLNKLKSEFENLSALLKEVTKIISTKENEINTCIECKQDLILLDEKMKERNAKKVRLIELIEETQTIDKKIIVGKKRYEDFQKSEEFQNTSKILVEIDEKKNEIGAFEKNMINMISNLSRPITKFSYLASKDTQARLATVVNQPLEIFKDNSEYLQLFGELRKQVNEKSIQIKDPEKTIHQIDEIINSLPAMSAKLKSLKSQLNQLESSVNANNITHLEDIRNNIGISEKNRLENIARTEETESIIAELDTASIALKKKVEERLLELTNTKYSIIQVEN